MKQQNEAVEKVATFQMSVAPNSAHSLNDILDAIGYMSLSAPSAYYETDDRVCTTFDSDGIPVTTRQPLFILGNDNGRWVEIEVVFDYFRHERMTMLESIIARSTALLNGEQALRAEENFLNLLYGSVEAGARAGIASSQEELEQLRSLPVASRVW